MKFPIDVVYTIFVFIYDAPVRIGIIYCRIDLEIRNT